MQMTDMTDKGSVSECLMKKYWKERGEVFDTR